MPNELVVNNGLISKSSIDVVGNVSATGYAIFTGALSSGNQSVLGNISATGSLQWCNWKFHYIS